MSYIKYWIIADTHFGHKMLVEKGYRPNNYEMIIRENLIKINDCDVLIHLGDLYFGDDNAWNDALMKLTNCFKWITIGNHDYRNVSWYISRGWDFACRTFMFKYMNKKILFSHEPQPEGDYDINIHGHFHASDHRTKDPIYNDILTNKHYLIAIERTNYKPILLDSIIKGLDK
jgi:calcineurin-like phosphoesterase family protein